MATWKERGEVPDSEDEFAYDHDGDEDLEIPPLHASTSGKDGSPALPAPTQDIWDLPASSLERIAAPRTTDPPQPSTPPGQPNFSLSSSPLSEPPSDISSDPEGPPALERRRFKLAKTVGREFSPDPLVGDFEPAARTIFSAPIEGLTAKKTPAPTAAPTAATPKATAPLPVDTETQPGGDEDEGLPISSIFGARNPSDNPIRDAPSLVPDELEQGLAPRVRTFRPRKPIQEHPYALENARYSNTFKSHGLRPLRLEAAPEPSARRRVVEEDSQEKEFQDDSQETGDIDEDTQEAFHDPLLSLSEASRQDTQVDEWRVHRPSLPSTPTTSLPRHRAGPSSQIGSAETQRTSVNGDADQEEFPPLEELVRARLPQTSSSKSTKRKSLSTLSSRKKRLKARQSADHEQDGALDDVYRLSPSRSSPAACQPSQTDLPRLILPDDLSLSPPSPGKVREESRSRSLSPSAPVPTPSQDAGPLHVEPVDLTADLDDSSSDESTGSPSEPEIENSAAIMRAARRLRGVLPPSYLRLDEKDGKSARRRPDAVRHPLGSPDKLQRKGVAQHRISSGDVAPTRFDVFEDSDEDTSNQPPPRIDDSPAPMRQTALVIETDEDDENESAMEDNWVDPMLPTRKRQSSRSGKPRPVKRMKAVGRAALQTTQPKITSHFLDADGKQPQAAGKLGITAQSGAKTKSRKRHTDQPKPRRNKNTQQRRSPVPRLSILDVIEPDAPKFLKVAARSARHHKDLGRSSPSSKVFQMATRWDHVDVNTVMQRWKGGHLKPRLAPDAKPRTPKAKERVQSAPRPAAAAVRQWPITKQRKLTKQVSAGGRVTYEASAGSSHSTAPAPIPSQRHGETTSNPRHRPVYRPAQLETASTQPARYSFHTKKRALDNLWRNSLRGRQSATPSAVSNFRQDGQAFRSPSPPPECVQPARAELSEPACPSPHERRKSKFRKNFVPKAVDVSAPQFSPADEPLPASTITSIEDSPEPVEPLPEANKLTGLAPYGTQYTHHFEIFPLDADVFFHESTLIGSGRIDKATDNWDNERLSCQRPRATFTLDGKPLRWGPWDEQVSSELGILMDWLSERIHGYQSASDPPQTATTLQASNFVLNYVQDSMSLPDSISEQSFAHRIIETMRGFLEKFKTDKHPFNSNVESGILEVLCRILVVVFTCNHICRKSPHLVDVRMTMEDLLIKVSKITAHALLSNGVDVVQRFLEDSRQLSFRQRGIRPNQIVIHAWVVLMRVLEIASIPKSGFWDVVNSVLVPQDISSETNSGVMEKLWKTMFTLLPLREFDSQGVIVPGIRRLVSMDGWSLPQRLIKRVFELYKQNRRQAASFNNYCRALISRCHYLTREWGWSNCRGIIGAVFDFFGSQHLSHLRNEEAYKSPRFLEELASNPSLVVEREDRCFHIFLKFVALAIMRLRDQGANKEIRNLVARVVPNHSRNYPKERPLHAHDLASLRNHHDLLCTLFWAAPRDLRPEVHLIEALISPADTHRDACLVNLRAWNQLARYIVSTEDDGGVLRVFHQWQCNIFRQLMDQFESAASDAQQQYFALSKEDSQGISQTRFEYVVSMNKATAKEIVYACVNASRDVLPFARSIPAATLALNTLQLGEVLKHYSISPPTLDWAILKSALETLNTYLFKVDALCRQQQGRDLGADDVESTVMTRLHRELSRDLFAAARHIIGTEGSETKSASAEVDRSMCVELITVLAAKFLAGLSKAGLVDASQALGPGIYGLFGREVHKLPLSHRKHLVLYVAILLKRDLSGVDALGPSLVELWLLALVKPRQFLSYENQLAEELKRRNEPFVPEAVVGLSIDPDYGSNRDLFEYAVSWMRQSLRDAAPGTRRDIVSTFSTALRTVMDQIKSDLRAVVLESVEHPPYVTFVRDIISLIRSHVTEICVVDDFFYQISKEYSPSLQDPRLHVAGIIAYGVRLGEGEAQVPPQLFYYLFNNFKNALINDKLGDETRMLQRGLSNDHILAFVLGKMVPAISKATVRVGGVFPLLGVYHDALARLFTGHIAGRELTEEILPDVLSLIQTIVGCLYKLGTGGAPAPSAEQLHVARQLCSLVNMLWPSIEALSYTNRPNESLCFLERLFERVQPWLDSTIACLDDALVTHDVVPGQTDVFSGLHSIAISIPQSESLVTMFQEWIVTDFGKNWVMSDNTITIHAPAKARGPSSTQSGEGIKKPDWDAFNLLGSLSEELKFWRLRQREIFPGKRGGRRRGGGGSMADDLIF